MIRRAAPALLRVAALLAVAGSLTFILVSLAPGDPFGDLQTDGLGADTLQRLRVERGLDAPPLVRYGRWVSGAVRGDLGRSYVSGLPVTALIASRLGNTLMLAGLALVLAWIVGVPLGVRAAMQPRGPAAWLVAGISTTLALVPDLVLALLAVATAVAMGLPGGGMVDQGAAVHGVADLLRHLAWPVVVLAALQMPSVLRHTEAAMRSTLAGPLADGLRARGIGAARIGRVHALRLASPSLVALFGVSIGTLVSTSLIVESVFSWPGMGTLMVEAVLARDAPLVVGATLVSATLLAVGALITDVLVRALDPRIRVEG